MFVYCWLLLLLFFLQWMKLHYLLNKLLFLIFFYFAKNGTHSTKILKFSKIWFYLKGCNPLPRLPNKRKKKKTYDILSFACKSFHLNFGLEFCFFRTKRRSSSSSSIFLYLLFCQFKLWISIFFLISNAKAIYEDKIKWTTSANTKCVNY